MFLQLISKSSPVFGSPDSDVSVDEENPASVILEVDFFVS